MNFFPSFGFVENSGTEESPVKSTKFPVNTYKSQSKMAHEITFGPGTLN